MRTVPFDPPVVLSARHTSGSVMGSESISASDPNEATRSYLSTAGGSAKADNIIIIETNQEGELAFWLQRKIEKSSHGVVRLGYRLMPTGQQDTWTVAPVGPDQMVAIHVMDQGVLDQSTKKELLNPLNESSALQLVANHAGGTPNVIQGSTYVAKCADQVYAVLPHLSGETLLDFCCSFQGALLDEAVARHLFCQILQVSATTNFGEYYSRTPVTSVQLFGYDCKALQCSYFLLNPVGYRLSLA